MKRRVFPLYLIICFLTLGICFSCAGYHVNTNNNPLLGYDIRSVAIPMFVNRTNFPDVQALMTKEIVLALNDFSGLKVYGGDNDKADAVLIGVLESKDLHNETFQTTGSSFTKDDAGIKSAIGDRSDFYYPVATSYNFTVRFILIKRPTASEIELLTSELGNSKKLNPKVVLTETLPVSNSFSRVAKDNLTGTSGGEVNFVKNKGIFYKSLQDSCQQTAITFKQVVLNAF
jgi:hypothetical protein